MHTRYPRLTARKPIPALNRQVWVTPRDKIHGTRLSPGTTIRYSTLVGSPVQGRPLDRMLNDIPIVRMHRRQNTPAR